MRAKGLAHTGRNSHLVWGGMYGTENRRAEQSAKRLIKGVSMTQPARRWMLVGVEGHAAGVVEGWVW